MPAFRHRLLPLSSSLLGLLVLILSLPGYTQTVHEDELLQQLIIQEKGVPASGAMPRNLVYLRQDGLHNQVFVQQVGSSQTIVQQTGSAQLISYQNFLSEGLIQLEQGGSGHHYEGAIIGNEIEATIQQLGESNSILQYISGEQLTFRIFQDGTNNDIQHRGESSTMSLKIYQYGSDMRLIIQSNH